MVMLTQKPHINLVGNRYIVFGLLLCLAVVASQEADVLPDITPELAAQVELSMLQAIVPEKSFREESSALIELKDHARLKTPELLKGEASQSSEGWGGTAGRAVDGNTAQKFGSGSCTHTQNSAPWWKLDLSDNYAVDRVEVWNRSDCCGSRLALAEVKVGDQLCGILNAGTGKQTASCSGVVGNEIKISLPRDDYLTLCEVKAYGSKPTAPGLIGCFADAADRDLPEMKGTEDSVEKCAAACKDYSYFGRQWANQCFCGNDYGKHGVSTGCNCGASNQGAWVNCVYSTTGDGSNHGIPDDLGQEDVSFNDDLIDVDDMMDESKKNAQDDLKELKARYPAEKKKWQQAKTAFRACRSTLQDHYKACRDTISKSNPNLDKPACAVFKKQMCDAGPMPPPGGAPEVSLIQTRLPRTDEREARREAKVKAINAEAEANKEQACAIVEKATGLGLVQLPRDEIREARREARKLCSGEGSKGKQKRCARKALRQLRREARRHCRAQKRIAKSAWKDFKGDLRRAKFNVALLPSILTMAKPQLEIAIADMDVVGETSGASAAGAKEVSNVAAQACVNGIIKEFMRLKLESAITPPLAIVTMKLRTAIFKVVDSIFAVIRAATVAAVGSIPFVGGVLAACVGAVISIVKGVVKMGIFYGLSKTMKLVRGLAVDGMLAIMFPEGKLDLDYAKKGTEIEHASQEATQKWQDQNKVEYTEKAKASQPGAEAAKEKVIVDGNNESEQEMDEEYDDAINDVDADDYDMQHDTDNADDDEL